MDKPKKPTMRFPVCHGDLAVYYADVGKPYMDHLEAEVAKFVDALEIIDAYFKDCPGEVCTPYRTLVADLLADYPQEVPRDYLQQD